MPDPKKCDPCPVTADDLKGEAKAVYEEVKSAVLKIGGDVVNLAADVKCVVECKGAEAVAGLRGILARLLGS